MGPPGSSALPQAGPSGREHDPGSRSVRWHSLLQGPPSACKSGDGTRKCSRNAGKMKRKPGNHREGGGSRQLRFVTRHRDAAAARHRARPSCGPVGTAGWLFQTPTDPCGSTLPTAGVFLCLVRFSAGLGRFAPRGALGAVKPRRVGRLLAARTGLETQNYRPV